MISYLELWDRALDGEKIGEKKYKILVEGLNDVVISFALDGTIVYCSPNVRKFGGYDPEKEIGNFFNKYIVDQEDVQRLQGIFQQIIENQETVTFEFLYKPAKKAHFYVEATANPVIRENRVVSIVSKCCKTIWFFCFKRITMFVNCRFKFTSIIIIS